MGNASVASPRPTSLYPTPPEGGWRLGNTVEQENTCGPVGSFRSENVCYDSGEWEMLRPKRSTGCCFVTAGKNTNVAFTDGTCAGCNCDGCGGNCLITGGGPMQCRLDRYLATPEECAFTGQNPQRRGGKSYTCDPRYLPGGDLNETVIREYCSIEKNFLTDTRCYQFCTKNDCTAAVNTNCTGDNLNSDTCKKYCFSSETKYDCGTQLTSYCADEPNQGNEICACFLPTSVYDDYYENLFGGVAENANVVISQINKLPLCSYGPCSSGQYKPRSAGPIDECPVQSICVQSIKFTVDGQIYFDVADPNLRNECQIIMGTGPNTASNAPPVTSGIPEWLVWVIAAAVIVALVILVVGLVYGLPRKT